MNAFTTSRSAPPFAASTANSDHSAIADSADSSSSSHDAMSQLLHRVHRPLPNNTISPASLQMVNIRTYMPIVPSYG
jgi:hypothetical protein